MREGLTQEGAEPTALAVSSQRPSPLKWKVVLVFKDSKPTHHRDRGTPGFAEGYSLQLSYGTHLGVQQQSPEQKPFFPPSPKEE